MAIHSAIGLGDRCHHSVCTIMKQWQAVSVSVHVFQLRN